MGELGRVVLGGKEVGVVDCGWCIVVLVGCLVL